MKRLSAALLLYLGLASAALAQAVTNPSPVAGSGAYNTSAPTCTAGQFCWMQTDVNGNLKVVGAGSGGATVVTGNVSNASSAIATTSTNVPSVSYNYIWNGTTWDQMPGTVANGPYIQGAVASGIADTGNPVKVGGKVNTAIQAFTNGQRADLQLDQRGGVFIQDGQAIAPVSVSSATTLFTVADTSGYGSISVQVTSAGTTCTITYEVSEDGVTWVSTFGRTPTFSSGANTGATSSTTATQLIFPLLSKMFRARVSTYTSGTVTIQGTLKKDTSLVTSGFVVGTLTDANNPGSTAIPTVFEGRTSNKTAVANATVVRPIATSIGAVVNKPYQIPELDWSFVAASGGIVNSTTGVTMVTPAGAGIRNYVTGCQISDDTLGSATELAIRDGAAGTVIWRQKLQTASIAPSQVVFQSPIKSTANTLLEVATLTASITGGVYVNCQGYQAP